MHGWNGDFKRRYAKGENDHATFQRMLMELKASLQKPTHDSAE